MAMASSTSMWRKFATLAACSALGAMLAADSARADTEAFTLSSTDIAPGGTIAAAQVYDKFGCQGRNVSPALSWAHAPAGTRSFALLMVDPDAPGNGWWHWVVYNIPPNVTSLPEGAGDAGQNRLPAGAVQGKTDFGTPGYGGPCPPPGKPHHYYLRLYALKVAKLAVSADATPALVGSNANANSLGRAELLGMYSR